MISVFPYSGLKPTYYKIFYHKAGEKDSKAVTVPFPKTNGVIKNLSANTVYKIYVVSYAAGGIEGGKTKIVTVTTPQISKYFTFYYS